MIGYINIRNATVVRETLTMILFRFDQCTAARMSDPYLVHSMGSRVKERLLWIPKSELRLYSLVYHVKMLWVLQNNMWNIIRSNESTQADPTAVFNQGVMSRQCSISRENNPHLIRSIKRHDWFAGWDVADCSNLLESYV